MLKLTSKEFEAIQKVTSIETRFIDLIKKIKYIKTNSNVYSIDEQLKIQKKIYLELKDIFTDFKENETSFRSTTSLFSTSVEIEKDMLQLYKFILQSIPIIDKILILIEEILTHKEETPGMAGLLEKKSNGTQLLWEKKNYIENILVDGIKKYVLPYEQSEANIIKSQLLSSLVVEETKEIQEVPKQKTFNSFIPIKNLALIGVFATFMWAQTAHAITKQFQEKLDYIRGYNNIENITKIPTGKEILVPQELLKEEFRNLDSSNYKTNKDGLKCFVVKLPQGKGLYSIVRDKIDLTASLDNIEKEKQELETIKIVIETGKLTVDQQGVLKNIIPLFEKNPHYKELITLCGSKNKLFSLYMATLGQETGFRQINNKTSGAVGIGQILEIAFKEVKQIYAKDGRIKNAYPEVGKYTWNDMRGKNSYPNLVVSIIYWMHNMEGMLKFASEQGKNMPIHDAFLFNLMCYNMGPDATKQLIKQFKIYEPYALLKEMNKSKKGISYIKSTGKKGFVSRSKIYEVTNYVYRIDKKHEVFLKTLNSTIFASK